MNDGQIFTLLGLAYLAIGSGMLVNRQYYKNLFEEFTENRCFLYLGGIMALVTGYLLVIFHNIWAWEWGLIITIFGWIGLIKGLAILIRPKMMISIVKGMMTEKFYKVMPVCIIVLGLLFILY
ncbi:MAG: hypothetical protein ACYTE8_09165 [Planctomycetota bacterium]|jgi:hypothetical protein